VRAIRLILVLTVGIEAAVVAGYGLVLAVDLLTQKATEFGAGVGLAISAVVLAVGLLLMARAAHRTRRGARAPILVWQILQAGLAREALVAGSGWGWLLIVLAVVGAVGVFWPDVLNSDGATD
jgi:hypothetical protein